MAKRSQKPDTLTRDTTKPSAARKSADELRAEIRAAAARRKIPAGSAISNRQFPPTLTTTPFSRKTETGAGGSSSPYAHNLVRKVGIIVDGQDLDEDYVANTLANVDRILSIYEAVGVMQEKEWKRSDASLMLSLVNTLQLLVERVHLLRTADQLQGLAVVDRLEVILKLAVQAGDLRLAEQTTRNINELQVLGGPTEASAKVLEALERVKLQNKDRAATMLARDPRELSGRAKSGKSDDDRINEVVHSFINDRHH